MVIFIQYLNDFETYLKYSKANICADEHCLTIESNDKEN